MLHMALLLLHCLLVGVVYSHVCDFDTTDTHAALTDPRWRVVSGLNAATNLGLYTQVVQLREPPLVNTSDYQGEESSDEDDVDLAIDAVCKLVTLYELVTSYGNEINLELILRANVQDSCNWLNYLVTNVSHVTSSAEYADLPSSCSAENATRLHHYCMERMTRTSRLRDLTRSISRSVNRKYRGLTSSNTETWLQSSSISAEQQSTLIELI